MKMKAYGLLVMALLVLSVMPLVIATDIGNKVSVNINTEKFKPLIWMCDSRSVSDDNYEQGLNGLSLSERKHNYAFEGEQIHWKVLVMDKNKIEEVQEVVATIGASQGVGNDKEVECIRQVGGKEEIPRSCNARIQQEYLTVFDPKVMAYYDCTLTVETPASMHGEYFITVEAISVDGSAIMAENEYWFLNPTIALSVDGDLSFEDVRPGTNSYSQTLLVGNDAEAGSGVILDMFISGDDFYDPSSSGARCPTTNQLALNGVGPDGKLGTADDTGFRYFVTNGAFSSSTSVGADAEGYLGIPNSKEISAAKRIMRTGGPICGFVANLPRGSAPSSTVIETDWNCGNALSPGSEMALTFKLTMPEPCVGDFSEGAIYFWGEAI